MGLKPAPQWGHVGPALLLLPRRTGNEQHSPGAVKPTGCCPGRVGRRGRLGGQRQEDEATVSHGAPRARPLVPSPNHPEPPPPGGGLAASSHWPGAHRRPQGPTGDHRACPRRRAPQGTNGVPCAESAFTAPAVCSQAAKRGAWCRQPDSPSALLPMPSRVACVHSRRKRDPGPLQSQNTYVRCLKSTASLACSFCVQSPTPNKTKTMKKNWNIHLNVQTDCFAGGMKRNMKCS